ncbi:hypothetical protein D047_4666A, partial [Vibrio parahaemolyticus VPTS-2010_2]
MSLAMFLLKWLFLLLLSEGEIENTVF